MAVLETTARANAALDELYREHVGNVYRYTYAVLGNHADAEDVTQTTFVNALRALERGETPDDPSRWLIVIAHNLVRQRWRQAAARPTLVELEPDVPDATGEEAAHELEELVRALQRIPETQREALVMRELEGRSYREIALVLGLSTSALETLLFRARRSLADELENVVTCQNAELAISKRLDGRLSRKERRRLEEHLTDCPDCARLAAMESRQRKALKGLALLPLPIGLALFKGVPSASAAGSLPTIGLAAADAGTTAPGAGVAGTGAAGAGSAAGGSTAAGALVGGVALKVAAIAATVIVAAGIGYKGAQVVRDTPSAQPTTNAAPTAEQATATPRTPVVVQPKQNAKAHVTPAPKHPAVKTTAKQGQATRPAPPPAQPHTASVPSAPSTTPAAPPEAPSTTRPASGSGGAQNAPAPKEPAPTPAKPAPTKPTAPKTPPVGKGDSSTTSPAPVGGSPDTGTSGPSGATSPATTPPATAGSPSPTPTTPPAPPVTTPPATTPPTTTPPATTPPADSTPPSTPPTGDTSGSSPGPGSAPEHPSSHAANPLERGLKLGLHKDENPDGHPSHP
jgi:RNA polymerase sigma factor (sigma-70 family)